MLPKQKRGRKTSTAKINTERRQAVRKLVYTPPTLITLGLVNQASACGSLLPPPPPGEECQQ